MPYQEHPVFVPPPDEEASVWRYMDLAKFVLLLEHRGLYFSRADLLGDPHEGALPAANAAARDALVRESEEESGRGWSWAPGIDPAAPTKIHVSQTFVSCWNLSDRENTLLWYAYGKAVAVRSTYASLRDSLRCDEPVYIGCVRYIDYRSDFFPADNAYQAIVHKRRFFEGENELRAVIPGRTLSEETFRWEPDPRPGIYAAVDVEQLIHAVHVAPGEPALREAVASVCKRFGIEGVVGQSSLDDPPTY
jgi:hypothetical protein